jgi:hypothetical protein
VSKKSGAIQLVAGRGVLVGIYCQFLVRKCAVPKMIRIGFGSPCLGFIQKLRHIRNHFQSHDDLIEMIEIISRQQGLIVDVGVFDFFLKLKKFGAIFSICHV